MTSSTAERLPVEPVDVLAEIRRLLAEDAATPAAVEATVAPAPAAPQAAVTGLPPAAWEAAAPAEGTDEEWPPRLPDLDATTGAAPAAEAVADRLWAAAAQARRARDAVSPPETVALPPVTSRPANLPPFGGASGRPATATGWPDDSADNDHSLGALLNDIADLDLKLAASSAAIAEVLDSNPPAELSTQHPAGRLPQAEPPHLPPLLLGAEARIGGVAPPCSRGITMIARARMTVGRTATGTCTTLLRTVPQGAAPSRVGPLRTGRARTGFLGMSGLRRTCLRMR